MIDMKKPKKSEKVFSDLKLFKPQPKSFIVPID